MNTNQSTNEVDYVLSYGSLYSGSRVKGRPYVLKVMAIDEAVALSAPGSYGGEVTVIERKGDSTVIVGRANNGKFERVEADLAV